MGIRRDSMEVERIGAYNPNRQYNAPMMQPSQRPQYQQQYVPIPPVQQQMPPVQQPVPLVQQVQPYAPVPPEPKEKEEKDQDAKEYKPFGRRPAIILSIVAFAFTMVSLFALPLDFTSFDTTMLRIGMMDGQTTIMAMTIITMVIAIVALLLPFMSVLSGILVMATAFMAYGIEGLFDFPTGIGCAVFVLLTLDIIVLGVVSTIFMKKFIGNNLEDISILRACYLTWTGIPHL